MTELPPPTGPQKPALTPLRSVSRMAIGATILGLDIVSGILGSQTKPEPPPKTRQMDEEQVFYDVLPEIIDMHGVPISSHQPKRSEEGLPYILAGFYVASSNRLGRVTHTIDKATERAWRVTTPLFSPLINSWIAKPFREGFERLVDRGETQVDEWRQLGQEEAYQGRELIQKVTISTVDTSIDYVAQQPVVIQLATSKTSSLLSIVMEYLRSIIVSLDLAIIRLFTRILRRPTRIDPVVPPLEIRQGATLKVFETDEVDVDLENTHIGYYAGLASRIVALAIDLFIVAISLTIGGWFIRSSALLLGIDLGQIQISQVYLSDLITQSIIAVTTFWIYQTLFWTLFGNTLGQILLGIRVLTNKGDLAGVVRAFLRASIGISLSISLFIISFFLMVFDHRRKALHDLIFNTVVVYTWDAHPSERFLSQGTEKSVELINNPSRPQGS
jgi:uncharacterized RDD family membrane protein YckC